MATLSISLIVSVQVIGTEVVDSVQGPIDELPEDRIVVTPDDFMSTDVPVGSDGTGTVCSGFACKTGGTKVSFGEDDGFCPPEGSTWDWDRYNSQWTVPGVALIDPAFQLYIGKRITTFGGPGEEMSHIPVPQPIAYNWWGDYYGITLMIWDTWNYTTQFPADTIKAPPARGCSNMTQPPSSTEGSDNYSPYYSAAEGGGLGGRTFLEGTPGADTLDLRNVTADGAIGFQYPDSITDTTGSDIIIPGQGDDEIYHSRGGADIYVYKLGDGNDSYRPLNYDTTSEDVVHFLEIAKNDVTMSSGGSDLTFTMPDGGSLELQSQFSNYSERQLEVIKFSDGILRGADHIRSYYVDSQVPPQGSSGTVDATPLADDHIHIVSEDGSYTINNTNTSNGVIDTLTFVDMKYDDAEFSLYTNERNLQITTTDGDTLRIPQQYGTTNGRIGVRDIRFMDSSPSYLDIATRMANQNVARGGTFTLTQYSENVVHTSSIHPSWKAESFSNQDEFDTLTFTETSYANAVFRHAGEDLYITVANDTITLENHFKDDDRYWWEEITFSDGTSPSMQQQLNKAVSDQLDAGKAVELSRNSETIVYDPVRHGDVNISTTYSSSNDDDRFETTTDWNDVTFSILYRDLTITFPDGDKVVIDEQYLDSNTARRIDTFVFNGVTYNEVEVRERAQSGG